jgi:aspartyl-tRNA(Asn)/glutamyl-tRNA(Gln) amidotransferase subunit A
MDPDAALEAARAAESTLNQRRSPLHGIPVGIKDIYYTKGVRTTCCSKIFADFVPDYDSAPVARLKQAGAIIIGKTVTTEFACGDPSPTRNPWNAAHTPGGSSSGSAVGTAARFFPTALGSQTGGSILRPGSYNGVVALKPTFGRVSRYGVMPVAWSLDTMGPFTRSVADAALVLNALAGHDPQDHHTSTLPVPDYTKAIGTARSPRIGLLRDFFFERSTPETWASAEAAAKKLADAGAKVEEIRLPEDFDALISVNRILMSVEAAAVHQENFAKRPDDYSPNVRGVIEAGMLTPGPAYVQAQRLRRRFREQMLTLLEGVDVVLSPSTPSPAPEGLGTTGDPVFQSPWTTCGLPALTIPSGLSASGLPMGIQLAAKPFDEETLLSVGHWCEQVLGVTLKPQIAG